MTTLQKIIKYLAIAFAIFLIINIMSAILFGLYSITWITGLSSKEETSYREMVVTEFEHKDVEILNIEIPLSNVVIKNGNDFKVESNNNNIICKQTNNKIISIEEENFSWFIKNNGGEIVIYIPEDLTFDKVKISAGAGKINIDKINTNELSFEIGAGDTRIEELNVTDKADIEGGAGKVIISSGTINNLDLDMGIGKAEISAKLTGNTDIDAGVGELDIKIKDKKENYKIKTSKGIGKITIDGESISNDTLYGYGENYIKIDGGIGSIKVDFN